MVRKWGNFGSFALSENQDETCNIPVLALTGSSSRFSWVLLRPTLKWRSQKKVGSVDTSFSEKTSRGNGAKTIAVYFRTGQFSISRTPCNSSQLHARVVQKFIQRKLQNLEEHKYATDVSRWYYRSRSVYLLCWDFFVSVSCCFYLFVLLSNLNPFSCLSNSSVVCPSYIHLNWSRLLFHHCFCLPERSDSSSFTRKSHQMFSFNVSNLPFSDKILDVQLRVLRLPTSNVEKSFSARHGTTYRAKIYGKRNIETPTLVPFHSNSSLELLDSLEFDTSDGSSDQWNVFSVKRSLEKVQRAKKSSQVLELRVESVTSGELVPPEQVGFSKSGRLHNKHALLVVFTTDGRSSQAIRKPVSKENKDSSNAISMTKYNDSAEAEHTRVRREAKFRFGGNKKTRRGSKPKRRRRKDSCRRKPMHVDFKQLGWSNWVIAPRGYSAYLCEGLCEFPIDDYLKPTNHATVQTILNSVAPTLAPRACCSPNKFSAISILYIDKGNIIYKKYEDMVVERCGCKWSQNKTELTCGKCA